MMKQMRNSDDWKSPCGVYYSVGNGEDGDNQTRFKLTATDMLKIGEFIWQNGMFEGKQIVSQDYINQMITPLKCNPEYGFLWWIWKDHYKCCGYGGQQIAVIPNESAVVVIQATATDRGMAYDDMNCFGKKG